MTGNGVNGRNGSDARCGARTLSLLAGPLNYRVLRALRDGPARQTELRRAAGQPAQTTLRAQLRRLCDTGALERRRRDAFPGALEYELSEAGRDLLPAMATLEGWLERSPEGPLELGGEAAKASVKALTEAWSTSMLRVLAAKPIALTQLDRVISAHNYPSLERRLSAMRLAGLLLTVRRGEVVSRTTRLEGHPEAWVSGSVSAWLAALLDRDTAALELGGDGALARALIAGLHEQLFAGSSALSP